MFSVKASTHFLCSSPLSNELLPRVISQAVLLSSHCLAFCWAILTFFGGGSAIQKRLLLVIVLASQVLWSFFPSSWSCWAAGLSPKWIHMLGGVPFRALGRARQRVHMPSALVKLGMCVCLYPTLSSTLPFPPRDFFLPFVVPLLPTRASVHAKCAHNCFVCSNSACTLFLKAFNVCPRSN